MSDIKSKGMMIMKTFRFKDVWYLRKEKELLLENEHEQPIGVIKRTDIPGCENTSSFSFTIDGNESTEMGIKKRGIKNFLVATYIIITQDETLTFKDTVGNNLLYFSVDGELHGQKIHVVENWSEEIEVKVDGSRIAIIKPNDLTYSTTIAIDDTIDESSVLFAITILMYFMYKIYKNESWLIENVLFD